jgi:hypothetical protein
MQGGGPWKTPLLVQGLRKPLRATFQINLCDMTSSDNLFRLVKSLSRSEKRAFKLFASQYGKEGGNLYVRLFDSIDAQEEYDETALRETIFKDKTAGQFSVTKHYLFNIILRSLRIFHTASDIDFRINEGVESAKLLFQRGIYGQAAKVMQKTKEYAWQCQKFELLLNMLQVEKMIMYRFLNVKQLQNYQERHKAESAHLLDIITNRETYQSLYDSIFYLYRTYDRPRSEAEKQKYDNIIAHPLLSDEGNPLSLQAKCYFCVIFAVYYSMMGDSERAYHYCLAEVAAIEESPLLTLSHIDRYISALNNVLHLEIERDNLPAFSDTLNKIRYLPTKYPNIGIQAERRIFEATYTLELSLYFKTKELAKGLALVPEVEEGIGRFVDLGGSWDMYFTMFYDIARTYYFAGELDRALDWLDKILFSPHDDLAIFIACYAKMLYLLIHYDKGNLGFVENQVPSAKRFLKTNGRLFEVEKLVFKLLQRIVQARDTPSVQHELQAFKQKYKALADSPYKRNAQDYLNIRTWVASKLHRLPIGSVSVDMF